MNIKLHTPKSLKSGSGMSTMKQLLLSLVATTISIALTFGTAALVDSHKKRAEKREMVMMILNDFSHSIEQLEAIDSMAVDAFDTQLSMLAHPETFENDKVMLLLLKVAFHDESSKTVETIFSSNIETINTLGNILFAEKVSEFYLNRKVFFSTLGELEQTFFDDSTGITSSYENLTKNSLAIVIHLCENSVKQQKTILAQCQKMMDVDDEELAAFAKERQMLEVKPDTAQSNQTISELQKRQEQFLQAIEAGRQK